VQRLGGQRQRASRLGTRTRGEEGRITTNQGFQHLTDRLVDLTEQMRSEQGLLARLAENQTELRPVLQRLAELPSRGGVGLDDATRGYIRNLDAHVLRIGEELTQGREATVHEIRSEIRLLARTIAALAESER